MKNLATINLVTIQAQKYISHVGLCHVQNGINLAQQIIIQLETHKPDEIIVSFLLTPGSLLITPFYMSLLKRLKEKFPESWTNVVKQIHWQFVVEEFKKTIDRLMSNILDEDFMSKTMEEGLENE